MLHVVMGSCFFECATSGFRAANERLTSGFYTPTKRMTIKADQDDILGIEDKSALIAKLHPLDLFPDVF